MNSKRIAIIGTTASNLYGFRKDFILSCIKKGYQIYAFVSEFNDDWLDKIKNLGAIPVIYKLSRGGLNPFADIYSGYQLIKKIKEIQPDIVFSYSTKPVVYGTLASYYAKVPHIYGMIEGLGSPFTIHKNGQSTKTKFTQFIQIFLYRIVFPFLNKIIFLNYDDPKDLIISNNIKHKVNAIQVLGPIGLNLQDYSYKKWDETQEISFIFIARLLAEKGIYEYLDAARVVKSKYPKAKFTIIGGLDKENPYGLSERELENVISAGVIEYPGFVNNVAEIIQASGVFVLPSYYREGVPRSTQEAMAIGRPVITTDVPGCRETVVDGVTGFLVPKWNPQVLAEKMIYFIEHPEQINKMGYQGYLYAKEHFDAEKVNIRLSEIIGI